MINADILVSQYQSTQREFSKVPDVLSGLIGELPSDRLAINNVVSSPIKIGISIFRDVFGKERETHQVTWDGVDELLSDLPVVNEFNDIQLVANQNALVRDEINAMIGDSWSKVALSERKKALRATFSKHPDVLVELIEEYKKITPIPYDFENDPTGEVIWYSITKNIDKQLLLHLILPAKPTVEDVEKVVIEICQQFIKLVEDHQWSKLLYDKNGNRKHESAAQLLFFGIAEVYCKANDLDLSPQSNGGRGAVDFKVSSGYNGRVLVEVKLTSNNQLQHGFVSQLPIYQKAESNAKGIYLVIDNGGCSKGRMAKFRKTIESSGKQAPRVIFVDGIQYPSASVADE